MKREGKGLSQKTKQNRAKTCLKCSQIEGNINASLVTVSEIEMEACQSGLINAQGKFSGSMTNSHNKNE